MLKRAFEEFLIQ